MEFTSPPQYLFPPNPSVVTTYTFSQEHHTINQTPSNTTELRAHVHGDHLSPQYLHPPNPSKHGTPSKNPTSWNIPANEQHQVVQNLSPQYLFPPNFRTASHRHPNIMITSFENFEQDHGPGDHNISPQYLFPPNFRSPSLPPESIAEKHWGVADLSALLKMKPIELKPWSLISLLDRLRYCQRPPFIISSRMYFNFYTNLLGTVAE